MSGRFTSGIADPAVSFRLGRDANAEAPDAEAQIQQAVATQDLPPCPTAICIYACDENRLAATLAFAGAGTQTIFKNQIRSEILELVIQPDAAVTLQIMEGTLPFSGRWIFAANQLLSIPGKKIEADLTIIASGACNVSFLARYRTQL